MVSSPTKIAKSAKRKTGILGVHPLLAAVAAMALMFAGAVFGGWLNMAKREQAVVQVAKVAPPAAVAKPRTAPPSFSPPVIANMDELDTEPPAIAGPPPPPNLAEQVAKAQASPPLANPLQAFALPFSAPANRAIIAIVIDDMGLDRVHSQRAVELPGPITLSFLTYANNLSTWAVLARNAGHEVLAHIPMEPLDPKENPGPKALTLALSEAEIKDRFAAMLDPWSGYVGVNNHMGSRFTADTAHMTTIMTMVKARGLLWLDSKTAGNSAGPALARAMGVPMLERDVFIDNVQTEDEVFQELAHAEQVALQRGSAIAIGHPHDVTLESLRIWMTTLPAKGISLAPISEIYRRQAAATQQRAER